MQTTQQRTTGINNNSITKRFENFTPAKVVSEYVWNGLDEGATKVEIILQSNQIGGVESIEIHDNGRGINFKNLGLNFDKFDDSSKVDKAQRGSQGRGRYAFVKFASKATWFTRYEDEVAVIDIDRDDLTSYNFNKLTKEDAKNSRLKDDKGTSVYLTDIPNQKSKLIPPQQDLIADLAREFGWKLAIFDELELSVNGVKVTPPEHELLRETFTIDGHFFEGSVIRWHKKLNSEKSYNYCLDSSGNQRHLSLTGYNNKYNHKFFVSAYMKSEWFDKFVPTDSPNLDMLDTNVNTCSSPTFKNLSRQLKRWLDIVYQEFLRSQAKTMVEEFDSKGYFPIHQNESEDDKSFRIARLKDIVIGIYVADPSTFTGLKAKQTKVLIALLDRISISNENDSLMDVLQSVLELDSTQLNEFSSQLKKSKLENIISTITLIQKRDEVIQRMKRLFKEHSKTVLETPDLQGIIESHTWLFGPQYETIGAEEPDFYENAKNLWANDSKIQSLSIIDKDDLVEGATVEGAKGEVDLFLARRFTTVDHNTGQEYVRCTIIEIKRPSLALNASHVSQVERYREVLGRMPEFSDENMRFDILLVGSKLSQNADNIRTRLKDNAGKGGQGLILGADDRIKIFVKTWAAIFNQFDTSHAHLLKKLKINRTALENASKEQQVKSLQSKSE